MNNISFLVVILVGIFLVIGTGLLIYTIKRSKLRKGYKIILITVASLPLLGIIGICACERGTAGYFCRYCGINKVVKTYALVIKSETVQDNNSEYTLFYRSIFPEPCAHLWTSTSHHEWNLLIPGGFTACSPGWESAYEDGLLPQLKQLGDKSKIQNVLMILGKMDIRKCQEILFRFKTMQIITDGFLKDNYDSWVKENE